MKNYGAKKATEFTKKQIGVIYAKAKAGELKIEQWVVKDFYDAADFYGYDDNGTMEWNERKILLILDAVFAGDLKDAQEQIDRYTETGWRDMSRKGREQACRDLVA